MTATEERIDLLNKVKRAILEEPRRLHMGTWAQHLPLPADNDSYPPCGTVACIAGWTVLLHDDLELGIRNGFGEFQTKDGRRVDYPARATELLHITGTQASVLFNVEDWPCYFQIEYYGAIGDVRRLAEITARRIIYFIETGE